MDISTYPSFVFVSNFFGLNQDDFGKENYFKLVQNSVSSVLGLKLNMITKFSFVLPKKT